MRKLCTSYIQRHCGQIACVFEEVSSTNAVLKEYARQGAPAWTSVVAAAQSAGRGRGTHTFYSPAGTGVYFSILLRPARGFSPADITATAAVAVCEAIEALAGVSAEIKWLNDIYLNGKKICGILAEAVSMNTEMLGYVIGIGINVGDGDFPEEIREIAAALPLDENGKQELFFRVIAHLDAVLQENPQRLLAYLKEKSAVLGKPIRFFGATDGEGIALDLDTNGGLIVALDNGESITLTGGEISIRLQK
jgi:BirA family biotin operon repressor/biotin-[acetyl-CoA-carboxylase] ligase